MRRSLALMMLVPPRRMVLRLMGRPFSIPTHFSGTVIWVTFRDPEGTLYFKLCTGAQLLQAIGIPKLPEPDVAKVVSLIMFVHAGGRNDSTVAEQLTQLQTFRTIMTSIANRTAVRSRIMAEPNELQTNDPLRYGVAYGSEPPSTCQLSQWNSL